MQELLRRDPRRRERAQRQRPAVLSASVTRLVAIVPLVVGVIACDSSRDSDAAGESATIELDGLQWQREQTSWALQVLNGSQMTLVAAVEGDPDCERFDTAELVESEDRVEISTFVLVRVPAADEELICEASVELEQVDIQLEDPLGDRVLAGCFTSRPIDSVLQRADCTDIQPQG